MGRRVFLSILGVAFYEKCRYGKEDFIGTETPFVQKNLLEYLQKKEEWSREDQVLVFLTDKARECNWDKGLESRYNGKVQKEVPHIGLEKMLLDMGISYQAVSIPEGKDSGEMWDLFEVIYEQLQEGDELYLDITNSFRYLPMLLVVLVNYAKLLKDVKVRAIFYGNYEARDKKTNIAPIMDLLPLSVLQDWTLATSDYLRYGQVGKLHELTETSMAPIMRNSETRTEDAVTLRQFVNKLKEMVEERITCRGRQIVDSKSLRTVGMNADKIQEVMIVQFKPLFEKIKESLKDFDVRENVLNCIKAAKWCFDNKLYQQATTLLEEGLITVLCQYYQLDYTDKDYRYIITGCIAAKARGDVYQEDKKTSDKKEVIDRIWADEALWNNRECINLLQQLMSVRNDYNHAGFQKNPGSSKQIIEKIEKLMGMAENVLKDFAGAPYFSLS